MRRDRLPFSIPLEEYVGEAHATVDVETLVGATGGGAAPDALGAALS